MSSSRINRARVARRLSRTGNDEVFIDEIDKMVDYSKKIVALKAAAAVDMRLIAIGADIENNWHIAVANSNEANATNDFKHIMWLNASQNKMWFDLLACGGTVEQPKKILTYMRFFPRKDIIEMLCDRTKEVTFVNTIDLFYFEEFFLTDEVLNEYPDIRYSTIDHDDITSGSMDNNYDLVVATGFDIQNVSWDMLNCLMNSVKVDGSFILNDSSDFGMLYVDTTTEFHKIFWDIGKIIASREDFLSYHLPYDVGLTVTKRIS